MKQYKVKITTALFSALILLMTFGSPAFATLSEVGPISPDNGFPLWYSDSNGLVLELCLDLNAGICLQAAAELPDPASPISFPVNFPAEAFWWLGEAAFSFAPVGGDMVRGGDALIILALEGAFSNAVQAGDQIAFTRVRFKITGLMPGKIYTITHPYGVLVYEASPVGEILTVEDIGVAPGIFTGALNGNVGPFLVWDETVSSPPAGYIGNPLIEHEVTGSPFNTNYFKIEGPGLPANGVMTDLFAVLGKLSGGPLENAVVTDTVLPPRDQSLPFGPVLSGSIGLEHHLTLTNPSNGDFKITEILHNLTATPFSIVSDSCSSATITPAGGTKESCKVTIKFAPAVIGDFTGSLQFKLSDFPNPLPPVCSPPPFGSPVGTPPTCAPPVTPSSNSRIVTVQLSGTGAAPDILLTDPLNDTTPANLNLLLFPPTMLGTFSDKEVWLSNAGDINLSVTSVSPNNPGVNPFGIVENLNTCSGAAGIVTPGAKCRFTIRYTPQSLDENPLGTFSIISNSPGEASVSFTATGTALPIPAPIIRVEDQIIPLNDKLMPFNEVFIGETKEASVTVRNTGNADLNINSVSQIQPISAGYSIVSDGCSGFLIQPNMGECTIVVRFSPTDTTSSGGSFDIFSNDTEDGTVTVSLSGTGVAIPLPDLKIQDSKLPENNREVDFDRLKLGNVLEETVVLSNEGSGDLVFGFIGRPIGSPNPIAAPFSIALDQCSGQTLSPTASCSFTVRFSPEQVGNVNEAFSIPSNDPDEPNPLFTLSGSGASPIINNAPSSPRLEFPANGQVSLGTSPVVSWDASSDPEGDSIAYTVHVCTNRFMTESCITPIKIQAKVALVFTETVKSISFSSLSVGTGLIFGMAFIGGAYRKKKTALFVVGIILAGSLLSSCTGGGAGDGAQLTPDSGLSSSLSGLEQRTTYFWKVIAVDSFEDETTSDIWTFTT